MDKFDECRDCAHRRTDVCEDCDCGELFEEKEIDLDLEPVCQDAEKPLHRMRRAA
jgi:hypothetical protein